jgi:hypothetical protein
VISVKNEVSPALMWVVLGVVLVGVVFIGYRMLGPKNFNAQTKGSENSIQKYQQTGEFYKPPPGVVPQSSAGMPGGVPTGPGAARGGYNLTPPTH